MVSVTATCRFQAAARAAPRSAHCPSACLIRSAIAIPTPSSTPAAQCMSHAKPARDMQRVASDSLQRALSDQIRSPSHGWYVVTGKS